ncbi:MAG: Ig-like domain-containing protein, partial [Thermoanaerobaculia bacterium]
MSYSILRQVRITLLVLAAAASALPAAAQSDFYTVPPCRVYDSRPGAPLNQGTTYTVTVAGSCGVPADAYAVALNVTVVGATGSGDLALFPTGTVPPFVGMLPFKAGRTQAVLQMVALGTGANSGKVSFFATIPPPPPSPTYHIIIDVSGYYLNAPPTLTAGGTLNYIENDPPTAIDTTITVADTDDTDLQSATVKITANYVNGEDVLSFVDTANITAVFAAATGTLTLTGTDTLANWETALRSVLYENTSDSPSTAARTVTWIVNDGVSDSTPDPDTSTINITATNDAPAGTDGSVSTGEDTDYVFAAVDFGFTDPNDTPANALLAVRITTLPALGSLTLSGGAVTAGQSIAVADITGGNLKFTPAANGNGSPYTTFTFQVQDDGGTANGGVDLDASPNTLTINVSGVNNPPAGT